MTRIPSPYRDSMAVRTGERVANGVRIANEAAAWMDGHQREFRDILQRVRYLRARGQGGRLRDRVAAWCCDNGVRVSAKEGVFVDNSLWAAICRYLVLFDPDLVDDPVRMRHSDVDFVGLGEVAWYDFAADAAGEGADAVAR